MRVTTAFQERFSSCGYTRSFGGKRGHPLRESGSQVPVGYVLRTDPRQMRERLEQAFIPSPHAGLDRVGCIGVASFTCSTSSASLVHVREPYSPRFLDPCVRRALRQSLAFSSTDSAFDSRHHSSQRAVS